MKFVSQTFVDDSAIHNLLTHRLAVIVRLYCEFMIFSLFVHIYLAELAACLSCVNFEGKSLRK